MSDQSSRHARRQAAPASTMSRTPRRRASVIVGAVVAGVAVFAGVAFFSVPVVATTLSSSVAAVDSSVATTNGAVSVTVPGGWTSQHPFLRDAELTLHSPDGRLEIVIASTAHTPDAAFAALTAAVGEAGEPHAETLSSGFRVQHATVHGERTVLAAIDMPPGAVTLVATVDADDASPYRPAIARVLDSVRAGG